MKHIMDPSQDYTPVEDYDEDSPHRLLGGKERNMRRTEMLAASVHLHPWVQCMGTAHNGSNDYEINA